MGIPSFYGWLVRKFPGIASHSPLAESFDNFYLDMNAIIHPCFHPENQSQPRSLEEVFQAIADRLDELLAIVRPRKLLFLAVDGVAPRAKMNQQRGRRFVAARERADHIAEEERLRRRFAERGQMLPPAESSQAPLDSNVITPGTEFMEELSASLTRYAASRLGISPGWENLQVIISDSSVPGEGEHKIMDFIRWLKYGSGVYEPGTSHCLYGSDADLILLALATHEQSFSILREAREWDVPRDQQDESRTGPGLEFVHLPLLRSSVVDLMRADSSIDAERVVDDFVFICCLIGNDFLPHVPTLVINDGAVEWMMNCYRRELPGMGDFLTCHGELNMAIVVRFLRCLAAEEANFLARKVAKQGRHKRKRFRRGRRYYAPPQPEQAQPDDVQEPPEESPELLARSGSPSDQDELQLPRESIAEEEVEAEEMKVEADLAADGVQGEEEESKPQLNPEDLMKEDGSDEANQAVHEFDEENEAQLNLKKLRDQVIQRVQSKVNQAMSYQHRADRNPDPDLESWKASYYRVKLRLPERDEQALEEIRASMAGKYLEGLAWILAYYYRGICSWQWYYPFYYSPFASDLADAASACSDRGFEFDLGEPLKPLQQLMAVLPPQSSAALPDCYAKLMAEEGSPLAEFYPAGFEVDYSGVNKAWKGVVKLPFVDEKRLVAATEALEGLLSDEEKRRNAFGSMRVMNSKQQQHY